MRRKQYSYRASRNEAPPQRPGELGWVWVAAQAVASIASSFKWKPKGVVDPKTAEKIFASLIPPIEGADWDKYLALYPDVLKAYQTPGHKFQQLVDAAGMHPGEFHFRSGGHAEGRKLVPLDPATPEPPAAPVAPPAQTTPTTAPAPTVATPRAAEPRIDAAFQQVLPQLPANIPNMQTPSHYNRAWGQVSHAPATQNNFSTWLVPAMIAGAAALLLTRRR